jgi:hypothetical protein
VAEGFIEERERNLATVVETGVEAADLVLRHHNIAPRQP